jgi:cyclic pyranopterin phosphate synthase
MADLTHIDTDGNAVMVDVSQKSDTERMATAKGSIFMAPETLSRIMEGGVKKGDVLIIAQLAGIMGAKRTSDIIPLCHPLNLSSVKVDLICAPDDSAVHIAANCKLTGQTGVEMEALSAVSIAALTVYDMCKAMDRSMRIGDIRLVYKSGGKSGRYEAE